MDRIDEIGKKGYVTSVERRNTLNGTREIRYSAKIVGRKKQESGRKKIKNKFYLSSTGAKGILLSIALILALR